jgi:hypothetical protein
MITVYLLLGWQAKAAFYTPATTRAPASSEFSKQRSPQQMKNICMMQAGDIGKLKYKGSSYEDAFSKVTDACFQRRTQLYVKSRNQQPDQDRQIQFAESCVNSIQCI